MSDRVLNFVENWIDANIMQAAHNPASDADTLRHRFLTDAVAAGIPLDEVNADWAMSSSAIATAIERRSTQEQEALQAGNPNANNSKVRQGGCKCGTIRFKVSGEPLRVGLCHCADCRKFSGSAFTFFAVWPRDAFESSGEASVFEGRSFCTDCGSRVFSLRNDEAEVMAGALDAAPGDLVPAYEIWAPRREEWLLDLPWADQYSQDRTSEGGNWRKPHSE